VVGAYTSVGHQVQARVEQLSIQLSTRQTTPDALTQDIQHRFGALPTHTSGLVTSDHLAPSRHIPRVPQRADPNAWARPLLSWHALVPFTFRIQVSHQTQEPPSGFLPAALGIQQGASRRAGSGRDPRVFRAVVVYSGAQLPGCSGGTQPIGYFGIHGISDSVLNISLGRSRRDTFVRNNDCASQNPPEPMPGSGRHITTAYSCRAGYPVQWAATGAMGPVR
jgi:hypothetical protein